MSGSHLHPDELDERAARPIWDVITAIKNLTPDSYVDRDAYHRSLDKISESAMYTAPEAMYTRWGQLGATLNTFLGDPDAPWKMTVAEVMMARKDYKEFLK